MTANSSTITMSAAEPNSVSFSEADLAVFSAASGDRNPLHLSESYARCTAYGQRVVFGCLGAIACLSHIRLPRNWALTRLQAKFFRPMFLGVNYRFETSAEDRKWVVRMFDGSRPVVALTVNAAPSISDEVSETPSTAYFERSQAVLRSDGEIAPGLEISGRYACDPPALAALAECWSGAAPYAVALLAWSSYLVGMELPGESALFTKFALDLDGVTRRLAELEYRARVRSVDQQLQSVQMDVSLSVAGRTIASGQYSAFSRTTFPLVEDVDSSAVRRDSLAGRVAVIIGASRGLGAAIKRTLELRGAIVYTLSRSAGEPGADRIQVGDAADPEVLKRLRERVLAEQGRLDILVCNACPPIVPLRLEPNALDRIGAYIQQAVWITLAPLCMFLDLLNQSDGTAVIISSAAIESPVREWPHYLAAKQAVEMLARVASFEYPRIGTLIVRPPKMLTTLTNTPMGRIDASSPALFANRIAARLEQAIEPRKTEVLS